MKNRVSFVGITTLALALLASAPAMAAKPLSVFAGAGFGKAFEDGAPSGGIGVNVGLMHQFPGKQIAIGAEAAWIDLGSNDVMYSNGQGGSFDADVSTSTIPVTGQVYYIFPSSGSAGGYMDAGLGLYSTSVDVEVKGTGGGESFSVDGSTTESDFGVNGGGGIKFGNPEKSISFGVDAKFHIIMTEDESTKVGAVFFRIYFR